MNFYIGWKVIFVLDDEKKQKKKYIETGVVIFVVF
jgi:hypothetical protein